MENEKRNIIISIILGLIFLIISSIPGDITNDVYSFVGKFITYKWLINIILILILSIILIVYHYRNSSMRESKEMSNNQNILAESKIPKVEKELDLVEIELRNKRLLANLSKEEKRFLKLFINGDTKNIRSDFARSDTANALVAQKIVYLPQQISSRGSVSYVIQNWAWEMLKKNPKYLD